MNHINIEQDNTITKHVNDSLIEYTYQLSKRQPNDTYQNMGGRLEIEHGYQDAVDFLNSKFSDLYIISTGEPYIRFQDSIVESKLANKIGNNIGVTLNHAISVSNQSAFSTLNRDTTITSFNELKYFTNFTIIHEEFLNQCTNLESVDISNIETISGNCAFEGSSKLKYVIGTENIKNLKGDRQFTLCDLTGAYDFSGIIDDDNNGWLSLLNVGQNPHLTSLKISEYLRRAPHCYQCTSLTTVTNGTGVTTIGDQAYYGCSSLKSVEFPNVLSLGAKCFTNCSSLETINFPSLIQIAEYDNLFTNCSSLVTCNLGNNITKLIKYILSYCTALKTLSCPNITIIDDYALYETTSLENIDFSFANLTYIGARAFYNSKISNTDAVVSFDSLTTLKDDNSLEGSLFKHLKFPVLEIARRIRCYQTLIDCEFNLNITSLPNSCFDSFSKLTSVTKLGNVTSIGTLCFKGCSVLTNLDFSNKLKTISSSAFQNCTSLVTLGNETIYPTSIGSLAFSGCTNFTGPINLSQCTLIGDWAFNYCKSLTSIGSFSSDLTSISKYAFCECNLLTSISGLSNVVNIGQNGFQSCNLLTNLDFSNKLTTIGACAFQSCTNLISLSNETIYPTSIGQEAFAGCFNFIGPLNLSRCTSFGYGALSNTAITSIGSLCDELEDLGDYTFHNCQQLTGNIIIPTSVTTIRRNVFYGCISLTSVTFLSEIPPTCGANAFNNTSFPIYVPASAVTTYQNASGFTSYASRIQANPNS